MKNIKGKPRTVRVNQGMDQRTYENINNEMEHYKKFPPFKRPSTFFQRVLCLFMDYRWARKILKGRFVKGEVCWLWCDEKNFEESMSKHAVEEESWR